MRFWLLRRPPVHGDITLGSRSISWDYDKVFVNARLKAGDIVYLIAAYNDLYGWGHVEKKQSYQDIELNGRAYRVTVNRPVAQILSFPEVVKGRELAPLFATSVNLVELNADQVSLLNGLLASKGVLTPPVMVAYEVQRPALSNQDFPKVELSPDGRTWLCAVYKRLKDGRTIKPQEMLVELWQEIPDFDYHSIDARLMKFGVELTLLGILQIDPKTELPGQTEQIIRHVKEKIEKKPDIESITAEEVSEELELQEERVALIFGLMDHLGDFRNGAGGSGNIAGYTSITIKDEHVKREYLRFTDLTTLLKKASAAEQSKQVTGRESISSDNAGDNFFPKQAWTETSEPIQRPESRTSQASMPPAGWDAFISHASEDKQAVARPLADELVKRGVKVWYDDFTLRIGDSLRRSIDEGLARSRFGVVILSPAFFRKEWPQTELDGLAAKQSMGRKVILPVWHQVTRDDVRNYSPTLADRLAGNTSAGIAMVADMLMDVIKPEDVGLIEVGAPSNSPGSTIRFLHDLWPDPVSIKVTMNAWSSGANRVKIEWPKSTLDLIENTARIASELEEYHHEESRFRNRSSDWVASAYQSAHELSRNAIRLQNNVTIRITLLREGMEPYFIRPSIEKALRNFLALANLTIQLKLALFLHANFPEERTKISPHLSDWLSDGWGHPRDVFKRLFDGSEPIYSAEIHSVSSVSFNHYVYGARSTILQAYFDFHLKRQPIINGWFSEYLIPQIELVLAQGWGDINQVVKYDEEARINKLRDEKDDELRDDPRREKRIE